MSNLAIVTGISRGLGASLGKLLLESGIDVIGISRTENKTLTQISVENNQFYQHFSCDLSDVAALEQTIKAIQTVIKQQQGQIETIYLLNNAGMVQPIHQAMNIENDELVSHVTVNTIAPMILTNQFLKMATADELPMIVANVSSGAAEDAIYGWSAYCSTKAGLNMYTKTVALEQEELETEHKIIAFSPGIMDTEMQKQIRASSTEDFVEVERFKDYKINNSLRQTDNVASILIDIIRDVDVKNGKIYNIKNYL